LHDTLLIQFTASTAPTDPLSYLLQHVDAQVKQLQAEIRLQIHRHLEVQLRSQMSLQHGIAATISKAAANVPGSGSQRQLHEALLSNFQANMYTNSLAFAQHSRMGGILSSGARSLPTLSPPPTSTTLREVPQRFSALTSRPASVSLIAPHSKPEAPAHTSFKDGPTSKEDLDLQFQRQYRLRQLQYVPLVAIHSTGLKPDQHLNSTT
jgi:hypothetical protein